MSRAGQGSTDPPVPPARVLIAGSNLFAGTLARALKTHGFATMHTAATAQEIARKLEWGPDLVLIDLRPFNVKSGSAIVRRVQKSGRQICVIDFAGDGDRPSAWLGAGSSAVVDEDEPFDQLFRTIIRLLGISPPGSASRAPATSTGEPPDAWRGGPRTKVFARLTEREQVVLSELMEGNCAEDIAKAAFVSISTVRSQIKAILQKLGVNSQLAAVAMARRAGWSLQRPTGTPQKPSNSRRSQAS
ncbi:MAG: LuxR C-terminal-related transcriptional regulator [Acidimicrobiales bacterium]|jgi:DNA-binding NarL/FixJ family response regulator